MKYDTRQPLGQFLITETLVVRSVSIFGHILRPNCPVSTGDLSVVSTRFHEFFQEETGVLATRHFRVSASEMAELFEVADQTDNFVTHKS